MVETLIKIGRFGGGTSKNLEKGPTLAEDSEPSSGPAVLTQVANLWVFEGQHAGSRQESRDCIIYPQSLVKNCYFSWNIGELT